MAIIHSIITLAGTKDSVPPPQGFTGILVDIFAGLFFLFHSLYGMQELLYHANRCRPPWDEKRPADPECEAWRRRAEPLFWVYLFVTFVFGFVFISFLR